ncbi:sterol desaturase family protein [Caulobacter mirabilis]|uniref:Beta-carotene hydroxylase n=1 Tax=Caulobacter mirabilis TaxID=69666 RepID=A0A2D2AWP1_9CAUL|nr:sterol desaturase family protein [Caulobacter mirabilis]ATQ42381.1 beta-carotene hydroxylase [Caulobacter mirabilis]
MLSILISLALFLGAFAFMEGFAWFTHKYVMHGFMWVWHKSHHEPREGAFELNDLFAVVFAAPAIVAIWLGVNTALTWMLPVGLGITAYGAVYFLFHDGLVHKRFPMPRPKSEYWKRLIQAHRFHHAVHTKEGCVSFGFLLAPPVRKLKEALKARGVEA